MAKTKEQKQNIIKGLKEKLEKQKAMVFIDFEGVDSKSLFGLRDELKENNCGLEIVKKSLFKKALENSKLKALGEVIDSIEKQLALVFGFGDEVIPAKICRKFAKENEQLNILSGVLDNKAQGKQTILELANLPSKNELLARLVGSLNAPVSGLVNCLNGNIKGLIYTLNAIAEK